MFFELALNLNRAMALRRAARALVNADLPALLQALSEKPPVNAMISSRPFPWIAEKQVSRTTLLMACARMGDIGWNPAERKTAFTALLDAGADPTQVVPKDRRNTIAHLTNLQDLDLWQVLHSRQQLGDLVQRAEDARELNWPAAQAWLSTVMAADQTRRLEAATPRAAGPASALRL